MKITISITGGSAEGKYNVSFGTVQDGKQHQFTDMSVEDIMRYINIARYMAETIQAAEKAGLIKKDGETLEKKSCKTCCHYPVCDSKRRNNHTVSQSVCKYFMPAEKESVS